MFIVVRFTNTYVWLSFPSGILPIFVTYTPFLTTLTGYVQPKSAIDLMEVEHIYSHPSQGPKLRPTHGKINFALPRLGPARGLLEQLWC